MTDQLEMLPQAPERERMGKDGWIGHKRYFGGRQRNMIWTHPELGAVHVRHCGHPTAHRPYYVTTDGTDALGRRAYWNLTEAKIAARKEWRARHAD